MAKVTLLSLKFVNDHRKLRDDDGTFASPGTPLPMPHWDATNNAPAAFTRWTTIQVEVEVQVEPAGTSFVLSGTADKSYPYLSFEGVSATSTKGPLTLTLKAKAPLPLTVGRVISKITWAVRTGGKGSRAASLIKTGPHTVYVLWADPILVNSMGYENALTALRLDRVTGVGVADGLSDENKIAARVQKYVNGLGTVGLGYTSTFKFRTSTYGDRLWGLLDSGTSSRGHCGEATFLM